MISATLLDSSLGGWATTGGADDIIVVVGRTYVGVVRPTGIVCTHYQMPGNLVVHYVGIHVSCFSTRSKLISF